MEKKKKRKDFNTPYTFGKAVTKGDIFTKLSLVIMGTGNMARGQITKGLLFFITQALYINFMAVTGIECIKNLISLGGVDQVEVWNEASGIYEYIKGDRTLLFLLYGVATIFITLGFILLWRSSVKSAYKAECIKKEGKKLNNIIEDISSLFNGNLHKMLLAAPVTGILVFTILPLVFMISMAFTTYSKVDNQLNIFEWSGLSNFVKVLSLNNAIGKSFWSVLGWTLIWAIFATGLNYILGMILAMIINRKRTKLKGLWRFNFVLSVAVPQFVSLLVMRSMLQPTGAVNAILQNLGLIDSPLPFWTDATWARVTVIVINLWVGIPFTLLQVTGILQNIPSELYEAAKVDGAGPVRTFTSITLPYMFFVTTPYLITTFMGNINNFNVIYLLSGGNPTPVGATAGKTDLLVTWLYKLTVDHQYYNLGAVIGIMTFVILATVSLITYRRTGSYKNEEGFQ